MSHIFYAKKCYYEASAAAGALLFLTSQIVKQGLLADEDFPALAFTGPDVANTPLRDQFADGVLGDASDRFGAFLDREHFHRRCLCLRLGWLVVNELGQQIEDTVDDLLLVSFHFGYLPEF